MTKEEYLKNYRENMLAEICAVSDGRIKQYEEQVRELNFEKCNLKKEIRNLKDNAIDLTDIDKLFAELKTLPAENFLKLYYKMHKLVNTGRTEECLTISNNYDTIGSAISAS